MKGRGSVAVRTGRGKPRPCASARRGGSVAAGAELLCFGASPKVLWREAGLASLRLLFDAHGHEHGSAHGRFWRALSRPDFPLSDALGEKHFDAGDGGDSFLGGELQELSPLRAIDQVHHDAAVQLAGRERRNSTVRVHADGRGVEDGVKEFRA